MPGVVPIPTQICHFTHIENLPGIIENECVFATNFVASAAVSPRSLAYAHIQSRRARTDVPCGQRGNLHDYVPFYFAPRSPMLYVITKGSVQSVACSEEQIVYICSAAQIVADAGLAYAFTDGHGTMALTSYFDELSQLERIDWNVMRGRMWNDTNEFPDRKRRRQAEFLVHQRFPLNLAGQIVVMSTSVRDAVMQMVQTAGYPIRVSVKRAWYYG